MNFAYDKKTSFKELLDRDGSASVHNRNLQFLGSWNVQSKFILILLSLALNLVNYNKLHGGHVKLRNLFLN